MSASDQTMGTEMSSTVPSTTNKSQKIFFCNLLLVDAALGYKINGKAP